MSTLMWVGSESGRCLLNSQPDLAKGIPEPVSGSVPCLSCSTIDSLSFAQYVRAVVRFISPVR
jgi:hypothetical protein